MSFKAIVRVAISGTRATLKMGKMGKIQCRHSHSSLCLWLVGGASTTRTDRQGRGSVETQMRCSRPTALVADAGVGGDRDALFRNGRFVRGGHGRVHGDLLADRSLRHPGFRSLRL